jgi:hypothetical protein
MNILRYSCDNVWTCGEYFDCIGIILYFYEYCEFRVNNNKNYEFGWHYALLPVRKRSMEMAIVKHCYAYSEQTNRNNYI